MVQDHVQRVYDAPRERAEQIDQQCGGRAFLATMATRALAR